jgi:hypothetical protein
LEVISEFSNILFILQQEEEQYKVYFVQFKVQTVPGTKRDDIGIEGGEAYFSLNGSNYYFGTRHARIDMYCLDISL